MNFENPVVFQAAKEPFDNGIISTCANITHAGSDPIARQQLSIPFTRLLRATVTVKNQSFRWLY
jgi:hypothetical protein